MIAALGTWIQSTTSAWIMTDLAPDALMVSLTQAAAQLPILFLVVPAGALADLVPLHSDFDRLTVPWFQCGQVGPMNQDSDTPRHPRAP
jgi:hypothetical protein